jgi:hypothetical protein
MKRKEKTTSRWVFSRLFTGAGNRGSCSLFSSPFFPFLFKGLKADEKECSSYHLIIVLVVMF